jgi:hypothetical protein
MAIIRDGYLPQSEKKGLESGDFLKIPFILLSAFADKTRPCRQIDLKHGQE